MLWVCRYMLVVSVTGFWNGLNELKNKSKKSDIDNHREDYNYQPVDSVKNFMSLNCKTLGIHGFKH